MPDGALGPYLVGGDKAQVVFHTVPAGQGAPLHSHDDSWAILVSGCLEVTVGEKRFTATAGETWFIPAGVEHGGKAVHHSLLVEVFCERRFSPVED